MAAAAPPRVQSRNRVRACLVLALATMSACGEPHQEAAPAISDTILLSRIADLDDDTASVIGAPSWVGEGPQGSFYVVDRSDRDVKFYDSTGRRIATIGRSGGGPGEFSSLMSAEFLADSLVAYDFMRGTATIFSPSAEPVRTILLSGTTWRVRVIDDSLLLAIGHPTQTGDLLRVLRRDGTVVRTFFRTPKSMKTYPEVAANSTVWADAYDGKVYVALFGDDRIFVYSVGGEQITTLQVDIPTFAAIAEANGGRLRNGDGTWAHHDTPAFMQVVALANGQVAYQIANYDTRVGTDVVAGSHIVFAGMHADQLVPIAKDSVPAGLIGRDSQGRALALGYLKDIEGRYYLARIAPPRNVP